MKFKFLSKFLSRVNLWYQRNLSKIVVLLVILFLSLLFREIPYVNIFFDLRIPVIVFFIASYVLFRPEIKSLVFFALILLLFCFILTILRLFYLAQELGNFIYGLFVLIFLKLFWQSLKEKE